MEFEKEKYRKVADSWWMLENDYPRQVHKKEQKKFSEKVNTI